MIILRIGAPETPWHNLPAMILRANGIGIYGPGFRIGPARWTHHDLIVLLEGSLDLDWDQGRISIYAHDAVLIPPEASFAGVTGDGGGMIWVQHFSAADCEIPASIPRSNAPQVLRAAAGGEIVTALIRRLHALREVPGTEAPALRIKLFEVLLAELGLAAREPRPDATELEQLRPAVAWAEKNVGRARSLKLVAEQAKLSESHFRNLFRKWRGESAGAWLRGLRMAESRRLLSSTDLPLKEIGFRVGFRDVVGFNRSFRQIHGMPPGRYRRANPRPV